jgi:hypothetical protein
VNPSRTRLLAHSPLTGNWFRAVRQHHFATALRYTHTVTAATRFSPGTTFRPGFPVLYFAENQQVCLFEVAAMVGSPLPGQPALPNPQAGPWTVFPVRVALSRVIDLTDLAQQQVIETNAQELTGDWRAYAFRGPIGYPRSPRPSC